MKCALMTHSMRGRTKIHAREKDSIMRKHQILKVCSLLLGVLMLFAALTLSTSAANTSFSGKEVYVGGMPFGVKFNTDGLIVVGFCDVDVSSNGTANKVNPARECGLHIKDIITHINGTPLQSADDLTRAVEGSQGSPLTLTVKRKDRPMGQGHVKVNQTTPNNQYQTLTIKITPAYCSAEGRYKTGLWIKDSGAGIGTVTFIMPKSHAFAGLGHGICDSDTGELVPMQRGQVMDVNISGIQKGISGTPGAIKGYFAPEKVGTLLGNTHCGVFGVYATCPVAAQRKVKIADRSEVKDGEATILCTLEDGQMGSYTATISRIDRQAIGSKCFTVTITDSALIQKTGGIIQGMSGSPILQNGKLVGAVTHVLVNDPTVGYGIFIENMMTNLPSFG